MMIVEYEIDQTELYHQHNLIRIHYHIALSIQNCHYLYSVIFFFLSLWSLHSVLSHVDLVTFFTPPLWLPDEPHLLNLVPALSLPILTFLCFSFFSPFCLLCFWILPEPCMLLFAWWLLTNVLWHKTFH